MTDALHVLLAGDHFVRNDVLEARLRELSGHEFQFTTLTLPWPHVPFGKVGDVDEASDVEDELLQVVRDVEIVVTQMAPFTSRVLEAARSLQLIVCTRGGPANINMMASAAHGVTVRTTPGRNAVAAAEHAVTLMLSTLRNVPRVHNSVVRGEWRSDLYTYEECGLEIGGSTVGLVGYGEIGRRVATILLAFGATVLVFDPFVDLSSLSPGVSHTSFEELLHRSDVVSLHARLTSDTANLIDATVFAAMKPGAYLINTARGGLVDYDALAAALQRGDIAGAGFDVFPAEPVPEGWTLLTSPELTEKVVMTPHLAGATKQTAHRSAKLAAAAVGDYLATCR